MERPQFRTKSEIIYQELKRGILSGTYRPQQRIITSEVAKEFGASESPVREAIKQLESDGLIENTPYVGAVVTNFDMEDIEEIYEVRSVLEGLAARIAAQRIKENDIELLEQHVADMEKALHEEQYDSLGVLNKEFHRRIYSVCGNKYLFRVIFELWDLSSRTPAVFALVPERAHKSLLEHKEILTALRGRDGVLAERLIAEQKENSLSALRSYFQHDQMEKQEVTHSSGLNL